MDNISNQFAIKLRELRKDLKLSQKELADKLGVTSVTISRWETGERPLSLKTVGKIAKTCGIDINYFMDDFKTDIGGDENLLINIFVQLNQDGRERLIEQAEFLLTKYAKNQVNKVNNFNN